MTMERDELKLKLEKKLSEHERTHQILKNTTDAFGECLSVLKAMPDFTDPNEKTDAGPSQPVPQRTRRVLNFSLVEFERSSRPILEPVVDLEGMSLEELRTKHTDLVCILSSNQQKRLNCDVG